MKKTDIFIKLHRTCLNTDTLSFYVFCTPKYVASETIEMLPCYILC